MSMGSGSHMSHNSDMRKQQNVYNNSKYNLKDSIKNTPGSMVSSKIGMK